MTDVIDHFAVRKAIRTPYCSGWGGALVRKITPAHWTKYNVIKAKFELS
jgi:hypothetical protein